MKNPEIIHISFSKSGGAGNIANLLTEHQRELGYDVQHIYKLTHALQNQPFKQLNVSIKALIDEYIIKKRSFKSLISVYRSDKFSTLDFFKKNNIIVHLHWTPGIISINQIRNLSKTNHIFWTIHDLWPVTGGCHTTNQCEGYMKSCENCPAVKRVFQYKIAKNKNIKNSILNMNNIVAITPSIWMKEKIYKSNTFQKEDIYHINNGVKISNFKNTNRMNDFLHRVDLGITTIGLTAVDLSDERKRIQKAIDWIYEWEQQVRGTRQIRLVFKGMNFSRLKTYNLQASHISNLNGTMSEFYSKLDLFVHLSDAENFPTTVIEALASGVPVVANDVGGVSEILHDLPSWTRVSSKREFFQSLNLLSAKNLQYQFTIKAPQVAERKFSSIEMTQNYLELYKSRINKCAP